MFSWKSTAASACMCALGALLAGGAVAAAQENGVSVDPESPAGKEYAVPIESARGEGHPPSDGATRESGGGSPAFGVGIKPRRGDDGGSAAGDGRSGSTGGGRGGDLPEGEDAPRSNGSSGDAVRALSTGGGGLSAGATTGLIALGVLLAGGLVALLFRVLRGSS